MSLTRKLLELLDRPGGRAILSRYATWHASKASAVDIEVLFDEVWMHRIEDRYWADTPCFRYHRKLAQRWIKDHRRQDDLTRDFWFHQYTPSAGDVIVDIGAGIGTDLGVFSHAVGPSGKVIAIEAHPETWLHLDRAAHWNQFDNVSCIQKAVVDTPGQVTIEDSDRHIANALQSIKESNAEGGFEVEGCTLDQICHPLGVDRIDFLKCNIEGAERFAIRGMESLLPATRYVCIACHDFRADRGEVNEFRTRHEIQQFLSEHGFEISTRDDDSRDFVRDHVYGRNTKHSDLPTSTSIRESH